MLCGGCEADLARALGDVPWLAAQLDVVLSKQGSHAPAGRRTGLPLPYDPRATEAAFVLKSALVGWVRILVEAHPEGRPADTLPAVALWLLARVERLAMHHAAGEAVDEICSAVRSAIRLVDRPADLVYAGPCGNDVTVDDPCPEALYARPDAVRVTCRTCRAMYDVEDRREWMLDAVEGMLFRAADMAHVLTSLGWPCTQGQIRQWASRGRVVPHGVDGQGHPVYRVSEVRERLRVVREREQAKRERMSA
jgi:hypothetical protein